MADKLPDGITREHILEAMRRIDAGEAHAFSESREYDVLHEGRVYAPKAVAGIAASIITGRQFFPEDFSGGEASRCHRIITGLGFEIRNRITADTANAWVFQGNPARFDIDDYVSRYDFMYWSTPRMASQMKIGDTCYIWRAGPEAGVIASGQIAELTRPASDVQFPDCLGNDLWRQQAEEPDTPKTGIAIVERRIGPDSGFLRRERLVEHPLLSGASIIKSPQGTVFRLDEAEAGALASIWSHPASPADVEDQGALEGDIALRQHFARERNRSIIASKKKRFAAENGGALFCELCGFSFRDHYPDGLGEGFIEIHHVEPLALRAAVRRTLLSDLMLVCSNCHRMIHRTASAEANLQSIKSHFAASLNTRKAASRSSSSGSTR